jgi:hypothetical protein
MVLSLALIFDVLSAFIQKTRQGSILEDWEPFPSHSLDSLQFQCEKSELALTSTLSLPNRGQGVALCLAFPFYMGIQELPWQPQGYPPVLGKSSYRTMVTFFQILWFKKKFYT